MDEKLTTWIDQKIRSITLLMLIVLIWESVTTGWDDPQKFVARVFAITVLGTIIGSVFGFLWRRSHFQKWL
jgi:hypothetical protein